MPSSARSATSNHDQRYARATEFMDVVRGYWHNEQFHYQGTYYRAEGGGLRGPLKKAELPLICTAGSSVAAREFAAKHADFYLMRAEHPDEIAALIADIRARALKGPHRYPLWPVHRRDHPRHEEAALAEAKRFFDEGVAKGTVKARAAHAGLRTARKLSYEHDYNDKDEQQAFDDFFIHPNVWTGFGYIGIPPGCALVGSYANVVARIREYHGIGIDLFFLAGYPHLEEAYRIGEHILPHFRDQRAALARPVAEPVQLHASNGPDAMARDGYPLSRRSFLGHAGVLAGGLLAGCGPADGPTMAWPTSHAMAGACAWASSTATRAATSTPTSPSAAASCVALPCTASCGNGTSRCSRAWPWPSSPSPMPMPAAGPCA
jgi:alkanesulfonate monooxygenase SsuD/methylene tetrahydromethanopterin reductase-like flavin-dependent oxidoreductase (luciferase family)